MLEYVSGKLIDGAHMIISKDDILSAMNEQGDFEIIKNYESSENEQGSILARWKGFKFYISFNDNLAINIKNGGKTDDELIYRATAYDFEVTFVAATKDLNADVISKYKIANYANLKSDLAAVFIYREDADMFEIPIRHSVLRREKGNALIAAALMRMVLIGSIAVQNLRGVFKTYMESPEHFLQKCKDVSA